MALPLQQQVDIWIQQAGPTSQGRAFNTVNGDVGTSINGYPITPGTAAACAQFGALICSKDLASLNATGQCPSQGNGGVRATNATLANGTANLDGNWQSICSWGQVIQKKIDASGCSNGNQASPTQPINCPSPTPATGGLMAGAANLRHISGIRRLAAPKHRQPASRRQHRRRCFRRPNLAPAVFARGERCCWRTAKTLFPATQVRSRRKTRPRACQRVRRCLTRSSRPRRPWPSCKIDDQFCTRTLAPKMFRFFSLLGLERNP